MARTKALTRKIHFFHYDARTYQPKTGKMARINNLGALFSWINTLPCKHNASPSRYIQTRDGDDYAMFVDLVTTDRVEGRMALVRRGLLPDVEVDGNITPLQIEARAGLAEISHFILYLDKPVLGVEFNFYGPRATRIGWYLMEQIPNQSVRQFDIEPYVRGDVEKRLKSVHDVSWISLSVHRDHVEVTKELNEGWYQAFKLLRKQDTAAERFDIRLSTERGGQGLTLDFLRKIPELLKRQDFVEAFHDITLYGTVGPDGNREKFDLLEDKLIGTRKIMALSKSSRTVEKVAAYTAIRDSYAELKAHLKRSFDD